MCYELPNTFNTVRGDESLLGENILKLPVVVISKSCVKRLFNDDSCRFRFVNAAPRGSVQVVKYRLYGRREVREIRKLREYTVAGPMSVNCRYMWVCDFQMNASQLVKREVAQHS